MKNYGTIIAIEKIPLHGAETPKGSSSQSGTASVIHNSVSNRWQKSISFLCYPFWLLSRQAGFSVSNTINVLELSTRFMTMCEAATRNASLTQPI